MAALRIFARCKLSQFLRPSTRIEPRLDNLPDGFQVHKRWGSYKSSPIYGDPSSYTDYDVSRDPKEWEYVERILKPQKVPAPCMDRKELPSGWTPPVSKPGDYPYFVQRNKNFMQPVYLEISYRGTRRITVIKKIQGDIWKLEADLKSFVLNETGKKSIGVRVNELIGEIWLRGDYVSIVKNWCSSKGF